MIGPGEHVLVLAIDFDGTLIEHDVTPMRWRAGAKAFLLATAAAAGTKIWLHTCRATAACIFDQTRPGDEQEYWRSGRVQEDVAISWRMFTEMRVFLEAEGMLGVAELWTLPGKPIADRYIDDRADLPDWPRIAAEVGVRLPVVNSVNAEQRGNPAVGAAGGVPGPIAVPGAGAANPGVAAVPSPAAPGLGVQT